MPDDVYEAARLDFCSPIKFYDVTLEEGKICFKDGHRIVLSDVVTERLGNRQGELIMGIRREDIKLDEQNLDLYASEKQRAEIENTEENILEEQEQ